MAQNWRHTNMKELNAYIAQLLKKRPTRMLSQSRICNQAEANQEAVVDGSSRTNSNWKQDSVSTAGVIKRRDLQIKTEYIFGKKVTDLLPPLVLSIYYSLMKKQSKVTGIQLEGHCHLKFFPRWAKDHKKEKLTFMKFLNFQSNTWNRSSRFTFFSSAHSLFRFGAFLCKER